MSEPVVLVVGEVGDWSADAVADAVRAADSQVFRLTTHDFPQRMTVEAVLDGGWTGTISTADGELPLDRVTGVYYRRPRTFDLPEGLSGPEERFARGAGAGRVGWGVGRPAGAVDEPPVGVGRRRGQWGWVAEECDLPIAEAIATELTGKSR